MNDSSAVSNLKDRSTSFHLSSAFTSNKNIGRSNFTRASRLRDAPKRAKINRSNRKESLHTEQYTKEHFTPITLYKNTEVFNSMAINVETVSFTLENRDFFKFLCEKLLHALIEQSRPFPAVHNHDSRKFDFTFTCKTHKI